MASPAVQKGSRLRRWLIAGGLFLVVVFATICVWFSFHFSPILRDRAQVALSQRFDSQVEIRDFHASLWNLSLSGGGIIVRYHNRLDVPPLISVEKFTADASFQGLIRQPLHISSVRVKGLVIQVPPRQKREQDSPKQSEKDHETKASEQDQNSYDEDQGTPDSQSPASKLLIDELICSDTQLITLPGKPGKEPKVWDIHHLVMRGLGLGHAASFQATLTNGVPPGEIRTAGEFGPWVREDPASTPVKGKYIFRDANLGVFHGISGILASDGQYDGPLNNLSVNGTTDIPDFAVFLAGNKVHLSTDFSATVDGSNGDTLLHPVLAKFINSSLTATGGVVQTEAGKGKEINLEVVATEARLEDLMALAVKGKPPMTGAISLKTRFRLPSKKEENRDIIDRLELDGRFGIDQGQFTQLSIQEKVKSLSRHGQGKPEEEEAGSAITKLKGRFALNEAVITFRDLTFEVTGASVQLHGSYGLHDEKLDFHGKLRLQAKLSQLTTGFKSVMIKPFDPFFRKNGVTELPIKITGTRENPSFGLDFGHKD